MRSSLSDSDSLEVLLTLVPANIFVTLQDGTNVEEALAKLSARFIKRSSSTLMRFKLRQMKQEPNENIDDFIQRLRTAAQKCPTPALSIEDHKNLIICDALVSGISSNEIRQRLLEFEDVNLDSMIRSATSLELAIRDSLSIIQSQQGELCQSFTEGQATRVAALRTKCQWCGKVKHSRSSCPAKDSVCNKC